MGGKFRMARSNGCWSIDPGELSARALQYWAGLSAEERSARMIAVAATNLARHGVAGVAAQHRRAVDMNLARHGEDGVAAQRSRAVETNLARHGEDGVAAQRSRAARSKANPDNPLAPYKAWCPVCGEMYSFARPSEHPHRVRCPYGKPADEAAARCAADARAGRLPVKSRIMTSGSGSSADAREVI
jgi:hypothetical protein